MRIGTGRADLSFRDGHGLYGFGPVGGRGMNITKDSDEADTLQARALYIERGDVKLLIVGFDLASGSRILHKALLDALAREGLPLADGQLWVVGTHTHAAPGHFVGNLYDLFGQSGPSYRKEVVVELVTKGLAAARAAMLEDKLTPCRVGVTEKILWGAGRNRSLRPFLTNFEGELPRWTKELNVDPPPDLAPEEVAVDPRLTVVAFVGKDNAKPLATWATWCCHAATIRRAKWRAYHRDWPGFAVDAIEKKKKVPFAMIHQRANGDVTPLPSGDVRVMRPMERIRELGEKISAAWEDAFDTAASSADDLPFELGFRTFVPREESLPTFEVGASVIVGSEEFDPGFPTKLIGEARTFPWRRAAQRPKMPAFGPLQWLLRLLPCLRVSPEHPMWLLRLGSHLFFASPFEQTTVAARRIEKKLADAWKVERGEDITASPVGLVGDYAGYLTTPDEFELQNYEGGHTIYGRRQLGELGRIWTNMITKAPLDASAPAFTHKGWKLDQRVKEALASLPSR